MMAMGHIVLVGVCPRRNRIVREIISLLWVACLACGCAAGGNISHADGPGAAKPDAPTLCRDGSTPPCNDRG